MIGQVAAALATVPAAAGRYRALFVHRDARLLLSSAFVSELGDWFNIVALIALSYRFGDGALGVGVMLALRMVPRLLLQAPAGALVDRHRDSTRLLVVTQLGMALVAASFALLDRYPELWLLYGLVLALESLNTVAWPAFRVQVARHVAVADRGSANATLALVATLGQLFGPVVGSGILAVSAPVAVFLLNGVTFLGNAVAVSKLRGDEVEDVGPEPAEHGAAASDDRPRGYGWLLRRRDLLVYGALELALTLLVQGTIALFVTRAKDLGLGEYGTGVFYTAVAIGSVVGSAAAGLGRHQGRWALRLVALSAAGVGLALVGFGSASAVPLAVVALVVAGLGSDLLEVTALTYFQHLLPDDLYGRFLSIFLVALSMGGIVGALLSPILAAGTGVPIAFLLMAAPVLVLAALLPRQTAQSDRDEQARPTVEDTQSPAY